MKKLLLSISILQTLFWTGAVAGTFPIIVKGVITTKTGEPLSYANVYFPDDLTGDVTDEHGRFEIQTKLTGKRQLVAMFIGYEKVVQSVEVPPSGITDLKIVMKEEVIELSNVSVVASSFSISDEEGMALSALDVVTTAGAAADIMRAIQTFPGVNNVDEGAGLFVRGGDVSETRVMLDHGVLQHPYKYESPAGGYFGTFSPFLLSGTFFSSGGFSAKYGNALSGVLAMESLGMPQNREINLGLGLAATSASISLPIQDNKFGLRFSGNKSSTGLMFRLNGGLNQFSRVPASDDANLSLHYRYSKNGVLKGFVFASDDRIGVEAITPTFDGHYTGDQSNRLYLLNWKHTFGKSFLFQSAISTNRFSHEQQIGVLDLRTKDQSLNARLDVQYIPNKRFTFNTGIEHNQLDTRFQGTVPYDPNDIEGTGQVLTFNETTRSNVSSGHVESELKLSKRWFAVSGLRFDHQHRQNYWTTDPRLSVIYRLNNDQTIKFATGIYHQFPAAYYYEADNGNPELRPMKAVHAIAGWEYLKDALLVRIEGYYKKYSDLILKDEFAKYTNNGHGYARGVDVFFKRDTGLFSGWAAYSFLQSKRKEKLYNSLVPTDYDITHHIKIAGKLNISPLWGISMTYRCATGRPFHTGHGNWNTAKGPAYQKLDLSFSYLVSFFSDNLTVFYFSISNILGTDNIVRYTYSLDYSDRHEQKSVNKRAVYFGVSFGF